MTRLIDKAPVYLELYEALAYFVGRQQLVVRAVIEQGVSPEDLKKGVVGWYDKTPQTGTWGTNWHFMFHGGGCRLTHQQSDEPIDWNGPDPLAFGSQAFLHHLKWRLSQDHPLPLLRDMIEQNGDTVVFDLIAHLIADSIISSDRRLIPSQASAA